MVMSLLEMRVIDSCLIFHIHHRLLKLSCKRRAKTDFGLIILSPSLNHMI